jgi:hypothetical protein
VIKGGHLSLEARQRLSRLRKGRKYPRDTRKRMSQAKQVPYYARGWRYCSFCGEYISPEYLPLMSYEAVNGSLRHAPVDRKCGQQLRSRPADMKRARERGYY